MKKSILSLLFGMIIISACQNNFSTDLEPINLDKCLYNEDGYLFYTKSSDSSSIYDAFSLTRALTLTYFEDSVVGYDTRTFVSSGTAYFTQQPNNTLLQPYVYYVTQKYNYSNTVTIPHGASIAWLIPDGSDTVTQMGYIPNTSTSGFSPVLISSSGSGDTYRLTTSITEIRNTVSGQTLPYTVYMPFRVTNPNYLTFKYVYFY